MEMYFDSDFITTINGVVSHFFELVTLFGFKISLEVNSRLHGTTNKAPKRLIAGEPL